MTICHQSSKPLKSSYLTVGDDPANGKSRATADLPDVHCEQRNKLFLAP